MDFKNNSSTIFFPYGKLYCRLYIYNFLYRNYNLEDVRLEMKYFELNGDFIKKEIISLKDDESIILDSKTMEFKRDIVVELSLFNNFEIKGIIRAFADYYNDKVITCVHEQGAFWSSNNDIVSQGNINLTCKEDMYALIQNTHTTQKDINFNIRVYNHKGKSFLLKGKKLKFREFCKFKVTTKEVCEFLNNKNGHFVIEYDSYIGRAAYIYLSKNYDFASISHATYYSSPKRPHTKKDYYQDKATIQSFLFLSDYKGFSSKVVLFNDYPKKEYFDIELYDKKGNFIKKYEKLIILKENQTAQITPKLLGIKNFIGSIKIIAYFKKSSPLYVNSNYIIYTDKNMADSAIEFIPRLNNVDDEFIKEYINEKSILSGTLHRSRQFCRGIINDIYDSFLIISFTSVKNIKYSTNIKISFISKNGKISITKYIRLQTNKPFFKNIKEILSKKELELLGQYFSIYLRDNKNKVVSLVLLKNKKTDDIGMDHFVGA